MFGPGKAAAALEGSKTFAKRIMEAAGVPTGRATLAQTLDEVERTLDEFGDPYVVKADGLAAGKGVLVTDDRDAALAHAAHYLQQGPVLVEEFLDGQEVSLFLLSDGTNVLPLSPAQDYKRLRDGDAGPEHRRHGRLLAAAVARRRLRQRAAFVDEVIETIALPTVRQLAAEQTPFIGLLYAGLILTPRGIRVIEFNARFGDPETQAVLPRLVTPLSGLLFAAATGGLGFAAPSRVPAGCRGHGGARERGLSRGPRDRPRDRGARRRGIRARGARRARRHRDRRDRRHRVGPARRHRRPRAQRRRASASDFAEARVAPTRRSATCASRAAQYRTDIAARVAE